MVSLVGNRWATAMSLWPVATAAGDDVFPPLARLGVHGLPDHSQNHACAEVARAPDMPRIAAVEDRDDALAPARRANGTTIGW